MESVQKIQQGTYFVSLDISGLIGMELRAKEILTASFANSAGALTDEITVETSSIVENIAVDDTLEETDITNEEDAEDDVILIGSMELRVNWIEII